MDSDFVPQTLQYYSQRKKIAGLLEAYCNVNQIYIIV